MNDSLGCGKGAQKEHKKNESRKKEANSEKND